MVRWSVVSLIPLALGLLACGEGKTASSPGRPVGETAGSAGVPPESIGALRLGSEELKQALGELAERERLGGYVPGLGLIESSLRERGGDLTGAVLAAYKELLWAYSRGPAPDNQGNASISPTTIEDSLRKIRDLFPQNKETAQAVEASVAFSRFQWSQAETLLASLPSIAEEGDSFSRLLSLICQGEQGKTEGDFFPNYGMLQGRFERFPPYWYHGMRFSQNRFSSEYAERCIDLAPQGPYAGEARAYLAKAAGLRAQDGPALRTKAEIETLLRRALGANQADSLGDLYPLLSLPDNPYTFFALGVMGSVAQEKPFKDYFTASLSTATGRLAERLRYVLGAEG